MRILFVWTGLTSYMGDCWRELAGRRDVDLKVLVAVEGRNAQQIDFRQDDVLRGLDNLGIKYRINNRLVRGLDYY